MRYLNTFLGTIFVAAFVVLLVTTNVRLAFNSLSLYEFGFARQDVEATTGLNESHLSEVARQVRDYFNSPEKLLDVRISANGIERQLFNQREISHMRDVKELVAITYRVQEGSFLYMLIAATVGFLVLGNEFAPRMRKLLVRSVIATYAAIGAAVLSFSISFAALFRLFHELSFANNFWQLDPRTSLLVQMFPEGFWLETTLLIGLATVLEASAILVLLLIIRRWQGHRRKVAQSKAPQFL